MRIAVVGCLHGCLDAVYASIPHNVDLVLVCGDFEAMRDEADLKSMAVPEKYRHMGDFAAYHQGKKKAPILTLVIGGNHEASRHLAKLWHGGWLAPNIYYMGDANIVRFGGLTIGGISGIYYKSDYNKPHFEREHADKLNGPMLYSVYHQRREDVDRLLLYRDDLDIFMSHDWPQDIAFHGDLEKLLKRKSFLRDNIMDHTVGSPPALSLLQGLEPQYWFSAHMHCAFTATYYHDRSGKSTYFQALDKVLPRRKFMKIYDIPSGDPSRGLELDPRWLSIVRDASKNPGDMLEPFSIPEFASPEAQTQRYIQELSSARRKHTTKS